MDVEDYLRRTGITALRNREYAVHSVAGITERRTLRDAGEFGQVLEREFLIRLPQQPALDRSSTTCRRSAENVRRDWDDRIRGGRRCSAPATASVPPMISASTAARGSRGHRGARFA